MSKPQSELIFFKDDGTELCRIPASISSCKCILTNTVSKGDRGFNLKFIYEYDGITKDYNKSRVKGVILQ